MKLKWILIGFAVIIIIGAFITVDIQAKKIKRQNEKIGRLTDNVDQLLQENVTQTTLILTEKEVTGQVKRERDSLAKALKVKPKQIEKIVTIDNSTHDTVKIPVLITKSYPGGWLYRDSTECLKYASKLILEGDVLKGERQLLEYDNRITQTFYRKAPHIWFIRIGKWEYLQEISSRCGENKTESITFIKK